MCAVSFLRLLEEVRAAYGEPLRRRSTLAKIEQVLRELHEAGLETTRDISTGLLVRWIRTYPERSNVTTYSLLRSFRAACSLARANRWLVADPFQFRGPARWLPDDAEEVEPIDRHRSAEEILRLLDLLDLEASAGDWRARRLRALVYCYAYLGLRKNEALRLRVEDIDLELRTLRIKSRRGGRLKTRSSRAILAISEELHQVLAPWVAECASPWVFPGVKRRGPWTGGCPGTKALDLVKAAGERAGIEGLTILDFRHSFATLAEGWGLGELELMRLLRHSRPATQQAYRKYGDLAVLRAAAIKVRFRA
jgi:integrase